LWTGACSRDGNKKGREPRGCGLVCFDAKISAR
jgi:hypothetical protein